MATIFPGSFSTASMRYMRMAFWAPMAVYVVAWSWAATVLPERVPLHFDVSGEPDNWGSRAEMLVVMALVGGGMATLFGVLSWYAGRLPLSAPWVNLPYKQWWIETPERQPRAQRMLAVDLHAFSAIVMAILLCVLVTTVHAAGQPVPRMPPLALSTVCALLLATAIWTTWVALARYRPRDDGHQ